MNKERPNILKNYSIKKCELKQEPLGLIEKYMFFHNLILKLIQHPIMESQLPSRILDDIKLRCKTPVYDLLSTECKFSMN